MKLRCSVIIPTYRRADLLERCLRSVMSQTLGGQEYEIVVGDDAAQSETQLHVARLAMEAKCRILCVPVVGRHGPAAARNAASSVASGDVLAFTDDDCCPSPEWLEEGLKAFEDPSVDAAWGRLVMPLPARPTDYERDASRLASAVFVTANCFCRKAVFQTVGGFDQRFTLAWREDSDLYFTLLERHYRVVHAEKALVTHPIRSAAWGVSIFQQRKTMFDVLLARKHPQLYPKVAPVFPRLYVAVVASILAICLGVIVGSPTLIKVAGVMWLLLTVWFCAKRLLDTSRKPSHVVEMFVTSFVLPPLSMFWRFVGLWRFGMISRQSDWPGSLASSNLRRKGETDAPSRLSAT